MTISVAFVDDHPVLLEGLTKIYSSKKEIEVVAKGANVVDALKIAEKFKPDILVLDMNMPGDTLAAIRIIAVNQPTTKVILFTANSSIETAVEALKLGVSGYVLKGSTSDDLSYAIKIVSQGETFISPSFATSVIVSLKTAEMRRNAQKQKRLNFREQQIVGLLLEGKTNREIASFLDLGEKTVKHYMTALMQKLDARNRVEAVLAAQRLVKADEGSRTAERRLM